MNTKIHLARYIDVLTAFINGERIQWKFQYKTTWEDWNEKNDIPEYNLAYDYRVKPNNVYIRLYKDTNGSIQTFVSPDKDVIESRICAWCSDLIEVELY